MTGEEDDKLRRLRERQAAWDDKVRRLGYYLPCGYVTHDPDMLKAPRKWN